MRILFVAYRGNMRCGGQGIYLWFLARELARLGHTIDVLVGPPYPDPMPFADSVTELPNDRFWGKWFMKDRAAIIPWENPIGLLSPLRFWELGASWIGFFPEPAAFSVRSFREVAARAARRALGRGARRAMPRLGPARDPRARHAGALDRAPPAHGGPSRVVPP